MNIILVDNAQLAESSAVRASAPLKPVNEVGKLIGWPVSSASALILKNGGGLEQRRDFRVECRRHRATGGLTGAELQDALQLLSPISRFVPLPGTHGSTGFEFR
ncbi:hypothetical protein [Mesorhizobium sp.]|uniref:hypothetical protein n=1 Tax=Mesorhizobium sp. TaxID=1871066 RepID=UPI0025797FF3|nr:hypothetical protein [Mesorhizobium sp.]